MAPRFDLIGIAVADMGASLDFYRLLGMDVPPEADGEGHVEYELPGGIRFAWDTLEVIRSFDPDWEQPTGNRMGIAFLCDSPAEVDELYREMTEAGYRSKLEPWDAYWGQRYAIIYDPDGNTVDLFARL